MTQPLTMDEILRMLSEIAKDESAGADRFRALKMLSQQESQQTVLPKPLTDEEWVDRLARIFRGSGRDRCKRAWHAAFPRSRTNINGPRIVRDRDLSDEDWRKVNLCISLKRLYREFPAIKKPGVPHGFPFRGREAQAEWCKRRAIEMLKERKRQDAEDEAREAELEEAAKEAESPTDGQAHSQNAGPDPAQNLVSGS